MNRLLAAPYFNRAVNFEVALTAAIAQQSDASITPAALLFVVFSEEVFGARLAGFIFVVK